MITLEYCGSCWAHASMSALADRIAIARNCEGDPINLSIQFVLNCGQDVAGSCHGGSHTGIHQFMYVFPCFVIRLIQMGYLTLLFYAALFPSPIATRRDSFRTTHANHILPVHPTAKKDSAPKLIPIVQH